MQSWQNIRNALKFLAFLTVVITVGGTALYYYNLRQVIIADGRRRADATVLDAERRISEGIDQNLRTVAAIAGDPEVRKAVSGSRGSLGNIREHLLFYRRLFSFISCTVLDREGNLLTSTDPSGANWESGGPAPSPPWFESALGGKPAVYMMLEKNSRRRRIIFSQPVYDSDSTPMGVVFIEAGADTLGKSFADSPEGILLLSFEDGFVFLSSRPSLRDRYLWVKPFDPENTAEGVNRFGTGPWEWSGLAKQSATEARDKGGRRYNIHERELNCCPGWTVTFLHDREAFMAASVAPFFGKVWYAFIGFCLAVVLAATTFYRSGSRNVNIRESTEHLLVESEKRFRAVTHTAKEAIFTLTDDDIVVYCNEAAAALFHLPKKEIEERSIHGLISQEDLQKCRTAMSGKSGEDEAIHAMEGVGLREGKAPFPIEMSLSDWETGGQNFSTIVVRDVTLRKVAEESLQEANESLERKVAERTRALSEANLRLMEMDRLKSMFLASMSHELRTPLNSIIGFTGILLQGMSGSLEAEQEKQLGLVSKSAHHLLALVNDVIDISKIEAGHITPQIDHFNATELVREVTCSFEVIAADRKITLAADTDGELNLATDRRRIKQVLVNLLSNALKFTGGGGTVTVGAAGAGDKILLSVRDTGMGIREEDREKLFQPFSRITEAEAEDIEGTGIGLYISEKIARLLGGSLDVESTYGAGSTFTLTLPAETGDGDS